MGYKLKIKITQEILNESADCGLVKEKKSGKKYNSNCAFALTFKEIFPFADVDREYISIYKTKNSRKPIVEIRTPQAILNYIDNFDDCDMLKERKTKGLNENLSINNAIIELRKGLPKKTFTLNIPDKVIDKINIDEVFEKLKKSEILELIKK